MWDGSELGASDAVDGVALGCGDDTTDGRFEGRLTDGILLGGSCLDGPIVGPSVRDSFVGVKDGIFVGKREGFSDSLKLGELVTVGTTLGKSDTA